MYKIHFDKLSHHYELYHNQELLQVAMTQDSLRKIINTRKENANRFGHIYYHLFQHLED